MFVEILPGTEGLVDIPSWTTPALKTVRDVLNEGDEVMVKVLEIDRMGKFRF